MWALFTANSLWILIASGVVIVFLLFSGDRVRDKVTKTMPEERRERVGRNITVAFWAIEGIALMIIALAPYQGILW